MSSRLPRVPRPALQLLVACAVLCTAAVVASAAANPAPWPPVFTAQSFTLPYGPGGVPVFARNSYSWPQRGNRIDHAAGSYECTQFYGTPDACSLLFTATQLYGLFQNGSCCVDTKIGVLPPNWGDGAKYLQNEIVFGVNATRWFGTVEHSFDVASDAPFLPVRFGFPQPEQDLYFDTHSFSYAPIDDAVFRVPADCTRSCK